MLRKREDLFSKKLLEEVLDGVRFLTLEELVPVHEQMFGDVSCQPRPDAPPFEQVRHLGLLWTMTNEACFLEHFSQTPTLARFRTLARKQLDRHHQLCLDEKDDKVPMRKLWVLSPGRPDGGFDALGVRPATELGPGMYFSSAFLEIWVVVLSELPKTPDTRLLRLLSRDLRAEVLAEIAALPSGLPETERFLAIVSQMAYFLKKKQQPEARQSSALGLEEGDDMTQLAREFEAYKAQLVATGEARGRAIGKTLGEALGEARGKAKSLLAVMAARGLFVNDLVRAQIQKCEDLTQLDRWITRAVTATSVSDVMIAVA